MKSCKRSGHGRAGFPGKIIYTDPRNLSTTLAEFTTYVAGGQVGMLATLYGLSDQMCVVRVVRMILKLKN